MTELENTTKGSYVHLGFSFHLQQDATKFDYTFDDEALSLGSSVKSGLRNSLHSSYDFTGMDDLNELDVGSASSDHEFASENHAPTSWRQDPKESGSDWIMAVESVPDRTITEYHVHKRVLAKGSKKCDFFVSLFDLNEEQNINNARKSTTKVHANAACLLPDMLDFLYSPSDTLKIHTETAVGLRHLSEFFGIRALARRAWAFIYEDICVENLQVYMLCAAAFDDLQSQKLCAKVCAKNVEQIDPHSDLLVEMDPSFLLDIISHESVDRSRLSPHMSRLVAVYCELHGDLIDATAYEELTTVEYLPFISTECAIDLMIIEEQLVDEAADERRALTYLQKRCVASLAPLLRAENTNQSENDRMNVQQKLSCLPKKVLVELLSMGLCLPS